VNVPAQHVVTMRDVVAQLFATAGSGSLDVQGDVLATTTLYNETASGRLGQTIEEANPLASAILFPLPENANFRANIGITEVAGGGGLVKVGDRTIFLAPYSHVQFPAPTGVPFVTLNASPLSMRVAAYVSMVDNRSGDATYFPARDFPQPGQPIVFGPEIAPIAGRTAGVAGSFWRTEEWLYLPPAHSEDAVASFGPLQLNFGAALRIWTDCFGGTCGDRVVTVRREEATGNGQLVDLFPIEVMRERRTNVGFSEVAGSAAVVRCTLLDAAGRQIDVSDRVVGALQNIQFPIAAAISGGRMRLQVIGGEGRVLGYASIVDNGTNDFVYIPGR
jgi:hypothetical protein